MNKYKLVLCDIDGTLLNNKKELTERTKKAIKGIKDKGVYFGIASGRGYDELVKMSNDWGIAHCVDVLVTLNGVQLFDGIDGKRYAYYVMQSSWVEEVLKEYDQFDVNVCVYDGMALLCTRYDKITHDAASVTGLELKVINREEFYQCEREKVLLIGEAKMISEIERYCSVHPKENYRGVKSAANIFEFTDKRVSKSYGIEQFCKMHGITLSEVITFGDTSNDVEMLRDCGLGICMENGTEDAKSVADRIAFSNDEEGVARILEELFL